MKKQIYYLSVILFISFFFSCKQKENNNNNTKTSALVEKKITKPVYGIDISHYQDNEIDFIKNKDRLSFIICKASEGITYVDPKFMDNWKTIKEKGFIRGAYHFYRTEDNPINQANFYLKTINNIETTDIPPIVDFEEGGIDKSLSVDSIQESFKEFLNEIEKQSKRKPIIYTDINTGNKYLKDKFFSNYSLWIANYNGKKSPDLPEVWKDKGWLIWQKSSSYNLDSLSNDFDVFNGSLFDFKEFIKKSI